MKLHDLRPAEGRPPRHAPASAGASPPAGQDRRPRHEGPEGPRRRRRSRPGSRVARPRSTMRIPKLHGFKNRFRVEYEIVNLGRIAALVEAGIFEPGDARAPRKAGSGQAAPITINQEILRAAGLVSTLKKPLKVLGNGDVTGRLFVVADAFSRSAVDQDRGGRRIGPGPRGPERATGRARARPWPAGDAARRSRRERSPTSIRLPRPPRPPRRRGAPTGVEADA